MSRHPSCKDVNARFKTVTLEAMSEAVPSINYIGRQLDVSYIGRQMSPEVRELHDHFLWRERALINYKLDINVYNFKH